MKKEAERTILQLVAINETGDSYYRMRWSARDLAMQAPTWRVINLEASAKERLEWAEACDLLILYQSMDFDLLPVLKKRRDAGKKTLVEYNDNFYSPQPWSPVAKEWSSPRLWYIYETFMRESDGILVTGPGLYELFSHRFKKPVYVLENHLPDKPESFEALQKKKTPYLSLGWAGSLGHIADLLAVAPTVKELLKMVPGMKFHVMGNESIPEHLGIPADRLEFTPWGTMHQYYEFWEKVHIGIAPLLSTAYNRCRSDIKAVEMSSRGVLPLLSSALPYENFLKATNQKAFEGFSNLRELFMTYASRRERITEDAKKCHEYVTFQRVGIERSERLKLFTELLNGTPEIESTWLVGAGYHELRGTPHPYLLSAAVTQNAQKHIDKGELAKALELVSALRIEQELNPEPWLIELRLLRRIDPKLFVTRLREASVKFPHEIRFFLMKIDSFADTEAKRTEWNALLDILERETPEVQRFYAGEIVQFAVGSVAKVPQLVEVAERLLALYPSASELRYITAGMLEAQGESKRAAEHYGRILKEKTEFELGGKFLEGVERSFLEAWKATLNARINDGLEQ